MAAYVKYQQFVQDLAHKVHNLSADTLKVALSNSAPNVATHVVLADISELGAGFGYSAGGATVTISSSGQTGGTYKLVLADVTFTASGGTIGPFRYVHLYNSTPSSPNKPVISYWDYGTAISITDGNSFTTDFSAVNGALQLA
jgi:hypothetical protein